jgi:vancomycin permeability regulator SanA
MTRFYSLVQRTLGCQRHIGLKFVICLSLFSLFACEQDQAPAQQTALLIEKLQAAKAIDAENLTNGYTDSTQAADSIYHAQKAQIVIG